jgi:hypothetical protein
MPSELARRPDRSDRHGDKHRANVDVTPLGEDPSDDDCCLSGHEQANERGALEERKATGDRQDHGWG